MPRYEFSEGTSNKFWEIERAGTTLTVRWGRIGAAGRNEKVYELPSDEAATKKYDKLVAEKTGKGYALVGGGGGGGSKGKARSTSKPAATKATKSKATATTRAWLADIKPVPFDDEAGAGELVTEADVEKNLGLPLGPVMRDLIALCNAALPHSPGEALAPLAPYHLLSFDGFFQRAKNIGYGDRPKSLRPFATDHKNVLYFYLSGTTTDDCPIVYENIVDVTDPEVIAVDLLSWLSQLAHVGAPPQYATADRKREHRGAIANLKLLPGISKQLASAELPDEYADIDFDTKPAKALASARADATAAAAPITTGGATVSAKDLGAAKKLLEKGGVLGSASDAKKLGFLKEALALVGGATEGDAAVVRLDVERELLSALKLGKDKQRKELVERLLLDWTARGITDGDGWESLAMIHRDTKAKVPARQAAAVRRAWATAVLTDFIGDMESKPKVPKDTKEAYNQARAELFHKQFARAHACLAAAKRNEHWGPYAETLEVEVLRQEGKTAAAKQLLKQLVAREAQGERYGEIQYYYLAAVWTLLDLSDAALRKTMLAAWTKNINFYSPSLFELA